MPRASLAVVAASLLLLMTVGREAAQLRETREGNTIYMGRFRTLLGRLPAPSVLFVRYSAQHTPHLSLITNGPDWERAPVWVVPDRGHARNAAFLAVARGRQGLLFDEEQGRVDLYSPDSLLESR